jgi:protein O-mannosyl-transferase
MASKNSKKNQNQVKLAVSPSQNVTMPLDVVSKNSWQPMVWQAVSLIIVATALAFVSASGNAFTLWDDPAYVTYRPEILKPTWHGLKLLLKQEIGLNYHPVTMASYWLNSLIFGPSEASFIWGNIAIHAANACLLFIITLQLGKSKLWALALALLWALHPIHVESVVWIAERKDVLYVFFFLVSMCLYIKFINTNSAILLACSVAFFGLACLSKAMAVVLPLCLLLVDYYLGKNLSVTKNFLVKLPYFIIALAVGLLAIHIQNGGNLGGLIHKTLADVALHNKLAMSDKILYAAYGFLTYIAKVLVPIHLHNFYPFPPNSSKYAFYIVIILALLATAYLLRKKHKDVVFGLLFFVVGISTVLQILNVGGAVLAERYSYLASVGLLWVVVYLAEKTLNQGVFTMAIATLALTYTIATHTYAKTYKNTATLFENTLLYEPNLALAREYIAKHNSISSNFDNVIKTGEQALAQGSRSFELIRTIANAYMNKNDTLKAGEYYNKNIQYADDRRRFAAYYDRGQYYSKKRDYSKAANDFAIANKLSNKPFMFYKEWTFALVNANRLVEAQPMLNKMIANKIAEDTCYNNLAHILNLKGDRPGAIAALRKATALNPTNTTYANNLKKLSSVK